MTTSTSGPAGTVSRTVQVAAPAERVWALVSDLPQMGAHSPENAGGRWLGSPGPVVGARFKGANRRGLRRWSTLATVTRCEPGRVFAFRVGALGLPVAEWSYEIEPSADGCQVTESWQDRRGALLRRTAGILTGVGDRGSFTAQSIERTLASVKAHAEA